MSEQSRSTLKQYFQTGNIPSQSDFGNLIDSFINETDDQVYADVNHNIGLGIQLPPARLAVSNTSAQVLQDITLTLQNGNAIATATLSNGVVLAALIYPGDVIMVAGIPQTYTITSVSTDSLQLSPTPDTVATNAQVTLLRNSFFIGSTDNISNVSTQMIITNEGYMGLGLLQPQQTLDVNGNVQATNFIGNGNQLTSLTAANITGQLPLTALPSLSFENIQGQLEASQLPSGYQPVINGIANFNCSASVITSGSPVTLSWQVIGATSLQLCYLSNYAITTLSSSTQHSWLPDGSYKLTPDITQTYTLIAYNNNTILNTAQLTITVIPAVGTFMQNCASNRVTPGNAVTYAGQSFNLGILCASNVSLLASAMKGVYSNSQIYQSIPAYYISLGNKWSPITNGPWITNILYPHN